MTNTIVTAFNSSNNVFHNAHGFRSFVALFIAFIIWSLAELMYGLFGGILHPRRPTTRPTTSGSLEYAADPGVGGGPTALHPWHNKSERIANGFRYFFPSLATVIIFNDITNGITKGFEVLVWIVLVLGILWAFGRGVLRRFADGLLVPIMVLFFAMWALGLRNRHYLNDLNDF